MGLIEEQMAAASNSEMNCKFLLTKNKVLQIDVTGVLSRVGIAQVLAMIRYTAQGRADAFCLTLDRALISVGQACIDDIKPADELGVSGAIVVRDDALVLAQHYAGHSAQGGLARAAFTSQSGALAWASHQAELARDQRAWALARRSR